MADRFAGRRALVTGAGRGIGGAIADRLATEGAEVVVADVDPAQAQAVVKTLQDKGVRAHACTLDVAVPASFDELDQPLDVVVANAGIQTFAPAAELDAADWDRVLDINARGALLTLQLAARLLRDGGSVVTVSSIQALLPNPFSPHYAASKAAVLSLTRSFAAALAPRGIRVNAVAPGRIDTAMSDLGSTETGRLTGQDPAETLARRIAANPLGRIGRPDEVAAAVAFLASDDASYITGECVNVCGGDVMV
ncbi:SDR family NAD(P)-dependent oxidoreductase [Amycolatopsis endophytica]|uniref:NAD(P)-dependent dehydrogenase (Short-subunit alcohol dehydrogenase family) n=1 Tax=Amycolatopsis endophytica TaxID=860233 RepID=A0A853B8I6_9PSEU|nr:SDR family NAD(P)-dependent oxidoreductase [Amycolatopsis endophytica]NYI91623.1 NAD(P)-dependent dehydrogenase (short-subunit alcohol dehydrogenase family) [Amycolatopsis endophytica]